MGSHRTLASAPRRRPAARAGVASLLAIACLAPALSARAAEAPSIAAEISATELRVGERARLTVTVDGTSAARAPAVPAIDGLAIRPAGQQTSMRIVNGDTSVSVEHTFVVEATRPGDFTIPPLRVEVEGRPLATEPIALRVLPAGGPRAAPPGPSTGAPPPAGGAPPAGATEFASLELVLPDRDLYVGEVVPAQLRLFVRDGTRVTGVAPPVIDGKAFSVHHNTEREPQQTTTVAGSVRWHVVTFPVALSPIAAGEQPIEARIEMNAIPPRGAGGGRARGGDPTFDSFFGGMIANPQKIEVAAPTRTVRVLPLPDAGRPPDFSGGIGRFTIAAAADPTKLAVGDPVTLKVTISGEGNFDRVALAPVESDAAWKAYPPSARFEPTDELGRAGRKTFEQAIVPQRADLRRVPEQRFSYFDPEAHRYVTLTTTPVALVVAPGAGAGSAGAPAPHGGAAAGGGAGDAFELAPNEIAIGRLARDAAPIALRPEFLAAQALPVVGLVAGVLWLRRRERRRVDPAWQRERAAHLAARAHLGTLRAAADAGDPVAFFATARRAVQETVAARRGGTAAALTIAEIESALDGDGTAAAEARALFAAADAAAYAGAGGDGGDLVSWRERVERLLARLGGTA